MAENIAKKEIEARMAEVVDALNKDDIERLITYYTPEAFNMPQGINTTNCRQALLERYKKIKLADKFEICSVEEFTYFELLDDITAYCNVHATSDYKQGIGAARRLTMLWRKNNGQWFIERQFVNYRETNPQDQAKRDIEHQIKILNNALSKGDIDEAIKMFADDVAEMLNEEPLISGKKAMYDLLNKQVSAKKKGKTHVNFVLDEIFYFEMFGLTTAHTNAYCNLVDENGKAFNRMRAYTVWKKIGDKWLVSRDAVNDVPLEKTSN